MVDSELPPGAKAIDDALNIGEYIAIAFAYLLCRRLLEELGKIEEEILEEVVQTSSGKDM